MLQQFWQGILGFSDQRFLISIIAAFILGLVIGFFSRYWRRRSTEMPAGKGDNAFFKGVQYLLSNDRDHAIEEFTKSVQVNSDTIETYVALGNLYRSKGDIERAIRIRQTIILRPNIDEGIKLRALFDLGLDYKKGGFLDRALDTFLDVLKKQPLNLETLKELEKIYEEMNDWGNAYSTRQKISRLSKGDHDHILAHHQTEMGKAFGAGGDLARAKSAFHKAISIHKYCVDAYLHLGDLYFNIGDYKKAIDTWKKVVKVAPDFTFLAYRRLEGAYSKMKDLKPVENFLKECSRLNSDPFTHLALARYMYNEKDYQGARKELESALDLNPSFWEARRFLGEIILDHGREEDVLESYRNLLTRLNVPDLEFQCLNCGFMPTDLQWQCPQCKKWDTIIVKDATNIEPSTSNNTQPKPVALASESSGEET